MPYEMKYSLSACLALIVSKKFIEQCLVFTAFLSDRYLGNPTNVCVKQSHNISNHWSFPDKEGEKISMEIFHSFSTIFSQFFHTERSGVWKF